MTVHQVEEYYLHLKVNPEKKEEIEALLEELCYSDIEFLQKDSMLLVNSITTEEDGIDLERQIKKLVGIDN